jgi:hypothetical protein
MSDAGTITARYILDASQVPGAAAQIRAQIQGIQAPLAQAGAAGTQFTSSFSSGLLGIVGPASIATAEIRALKEIINLSEEGEGINRTTRSFESLAKQSGATGDAILGALRKASGGEISDLNLELGVNKGILLGVANSATEFADVMEIARDRAAKMGITTTQAFDNITTGIGRESPRILDNLGIIISLSDAHQKYADSVGKSVDQLTKAERIEAVRIAVIAQGKSTLDAATTAANDQANAITRLNVALQNAKDRGASGLAETYGRYAQSLFQGVDAAKALVTAVEDQFTTTEAEQAATDAYAATLERTGSVVQANAAYEQALTAARAAAVPVVQQVTAGLIQGGGAYDAYAQAANAAGIAANEAAGRINFSAQALQLGAQASVLATAQQQAQTAATTALTQETNAAVTAFLNMNPNIDAAGIAAQIAAGKVPVLIGELANLRLGVDATTAAMARLASQQAGISGVSALFNAGIDPGKGTVGGLGDRIGGGASGLLADQNRLAALQLQNQLINAKTAAERIAILKGQLARTVDAEERQRIQNQIDQEKKAGGGRVGAAQTTALQLQNVEQNSGAQLLKIQRENLERLRDQQEDFDVKRARSKEDEDRKIRRLLAQGQIGAANREREDFAREQQRAQEDFDRQRRRTNRNNAEGVGDAEGAADRRTGQIQARAALRGVTGGGSAGGGSARGASLSGAGGVSGGARVIQVNMPMVLTTPDGQVLARITYPFIQAQLDEDLSIEMRGATPPGGSQTAVAGARP